MYEEKTIDKNKKIFLVAFIVPFINMIAFLIEFLITGKQTIHSTYSENVGFVLEFFIVPILFTIALIIPKKILKFKTEILYTLSLMFMFGWVLITTSYSIIEFVRKLVS